MLGLIAGVAIGAAAALAYSNRAVLVKDVHSAYADAVTDLDLIEQRLMGTSIRAGNAADAHAVLASQNASVAAKAANVAAAVNTAKTQVTAPTKTG